MNSNTKIKIRVKEDTININRRIKTQANQATNRLSFNFQKPTYKQPLAENKKHINQTENIIPKKAKPINTIANNRNNKTIYSKNNTEHHENKPQIFPQNAKLMMDKLFGNPKKENTFGLTATTFVKNKENMKEAKESARISGAARYAFETQVGSGTFGTVHKARDKLNVEVVAIKKVYQDKKYKNRQLQILKTLDHPNTLKIKDSFYTYEVDKEYLNVVMDFFPTNLYDYIQRYKNRIEISRLKLKVLAYQMFRGLMYLEKMQIAHRDIKPQNILVNDSNLTLLICDFGSAKKLQPNEPNLAYICSRCYRAPELIFGSTAYTTQIDMWSAGCVLIEMITLEPIFRSESNIDQLVQIIKILGTPTFQEMMEMNQDCDVDKFQFPKIGSRNWEKVIKKKQYGPEFYDLLSNVLKYSPKRRFTPAQALIHPFFNELREAETYGMLVKENKIGNLFNFSQMQLASLTTQQINVLVPKWSKS